MLCAIDKDRYSFGGSVACNNEIETGMSFTARSQPMKGSKEGCLLGQKMTCMLHTSLSVCGFRVAHIPFYVCIPCYTHPFLFVHSVLHTSLYVCAFRVTSLSICAFRVVRSGLSAAGLGLELPKLLQEGGLREEGLR